MMCGREHGKVKLFDYGNISILDCRYLTNFVAKDFEAAAGGGKWKIENGRWKIEIGK